MRTIPSAVQPSSESPIVIIGGGPVGLWIACELKKRNPSDSIVVLERFEEYQRQHTIKLKTVSFLMYASTSASAAKKEFLNDLLGHSSIWDAWGSALDKNFIKTKDLEASLKKYAISLNVVIKYVLVADEDHLLSLYPNPYLVICADGAHSRLRTSLLGPVEVKKLQSLVDLKLNLTVDVLAENTRSNITSALVPKSISQALNYCKKHGRIIQLNVGRPSADAPHVFPLIARCFLTKEEHNLLQEFLKKDYAKYGEGTYKRPIQVEDLCKGLESGGVIALDALRKILLNVKCDLIQKLSTRPLLNQAKLEFTPSTLLTLTTYRAPKGHTFLKTPQGNTVSVLFVGDAAFGVPYFRALNAGLMLASRLAHIYRGPFSKKVSPNNWVKCNAYGLTFYLHWYTELFIVAYKQAGLKLLSFLIKSGK